MAAVSTVEMIKVYTDHYTFAKSMGEDYLESAMYFAKKGNDEEYQRCIQKAAEWFGLQQTWLDMARNDKCYIVD